MLDVGRAWKAEGVVSIRLSTGISALLIFYFANHPPRYHLKMLNYNRFKEGLFVCDSTPIENRNSLESLYRENSSTIFFGSEFFLKGGGKDVQT